MSKREREGTSDVEQRLINLRKTMAVSYTHLTLPTTAIV